MASAISAEVAVERPYRTAAADDPRLQGFAEYQRADGILIAVRPPDGSNGLFQLRRDRDRIHPDGKAAKYEQPAGQPHRLAVHPRNLRHLSDPGVPLWITEGIKKGDALVSHGLCAVTLLGVWNWRGRNEHNGRTVLSEWEYVALNGQRPVSIVYDSDVMRKPNVYKALARLKPLLENR